MKILRLTLCLFFISTLFSYGSDLDQALLWKVSGNGLEKPSYLFGTIHVICERDMVMKESFKNALSNSEKVVLELDMDDPQLMQKMQQLSVSEGMKNFSDQLKEDEKELINQFLTKNYGGSLQQFGILKPFIVMTMVYPTYIDCKMPSAYESVFTQMAKERQMEVVGLETVAFQMGIFDQIPTNEQIDMLVKSVKDSTQTKKDLSDMISAYQNQNISKLNQLVKDTPEYAKYEDLLLNDRNKSWIAKIEEHMQDQSSFIAVGAAHLAGSEGVIQLLREKGYEVNPVEE